MRNGWDMKNIKINSLAKAFSMSGLIFLASTASGQQQIVQKIPSTPEENYAVAETFAHCSGFYGFAALIAKQDGLSETVRAFEDVQRGWKLAGMFFLAESMSKDKTLTTEQTFDYLVENEITVMKSKYEIDPNGSNAEFQNNYKIKCEPWVDVQKKIIEYVRRK